MGRLELIGRKFGRLLVIAQDCIKNQRVFWLCQCDCGNEKSVNGSHLMNGAIKSCGCLQNEVRIQTHTIHGDHGTKEYIAWKSMKGRCYNENNEKYPNYGGRGIIVCERWLNSYDTFLSDMGRSPSNKLSLDRINTNGNYELGNCRWATSETQMNNMTTNRHITYKGETLNIGQWERRFNLTHGRFRKQRFKGWDGEKIVEFFDNLIKLKPINELSITT